MRLVIVGAGGFGREVLAYARDTARDHRDGAAFTEIVLLDDRPDALDGYEVDARVVGGVDDGPIGPDDRVIVAVGDPAARFALVRRLQPRNVQFATLVHPLAYVATDARIQPGVVIGPFGFVGPSAWVGPHVVLNTYASVGHDAVVGRYAVLSPYSVVNGGVSVGEGAFLGTQAAVVVGLTVGPWAKLAAGAVAHRDVETGTLAVGNPARGRVMFAPPEGWGSPDAPSLANV